MAAYTARHALPVAWVQPYTQTPTRRPTILYSGLPIQEPPHVHQRHHAPSRLTTTAPLTRARLIGLAFVFLWFAIGGIAHFALTATEMRIVPPWIHWPREAVLISGVFELLGAAGLLWQQSRRAAGIGLLLLTLAVTPAHIYMLQQPELFAVPVWLLWLRLPVQLALLALIAWCTRREKSSSA